MEITGWRKPVVIALGCALVLLAVLSHIVPELEQWVKYTMKAIEWVLP